MVLLQNGKGFEITCSILSTHSEPSKLSRVKPEWPQVSGSWHRLRGTECAVSWPWSQSVEALKLSKYHQGRNRQLPDGPLADPGARFSRTGLLSATRSVEIRCIHTIVGGGFEVRRLLQPCGELAFPNSSTSL